MIESTPAETQAILALARQAQMQESFLDADGDPVKIGSFVRYNKDREWPWDTSRWGIVTGLARSPVNPKFREEGDPTHHVTVRVEAVTVTDGEGSMGWGGDFWVAGPETLKVIK